MRQSPQRVQQVRNSFSGKAQGGRMGKGFPPRRNIRRSEFMIMATPVFCIGLRQIYGTTSDIIQRGFWETNRKNSEGNTYEQIAAQKKGSAVLPLTLDCAVVPEVGIEPTWGRPRGILSPVRLPVSPLRLNGVATARKDRTEEHYRSVAVPCQALKNALLPFCFSGHCREKFSGTGKNNPLPTRPS